MPFATLLSLCRKSTSVFEPCQDTAAIKHRELTKDKPFCLVTFHVVMETMASRIIDSRCTNLEEENQNAVHIVVLGDIMTGEINVAGLK